MNPAPMHVRRSLAALPLAAAVLLAFAACRWSVPADPGRNAALRARPEPTDAAGSAPGTGNEPLALARGPDDPAAGALYGRRCAQCHEPFAPTTFTAAEWPTYVDRYGPRAGLFGSERARVLAWLQAHAR